jgi:hypothetical protein
MHKYWHFIDTPFTIDGTALPAIPTPNAQERIALFRTVLASTSADPLKSYDLTWLLHLVGDALTASYKKNAGKLAKVRVELAGARLANLLNTELK